MPQPEGMYRRVWKILFNFVTHESFTYSDWTEIVERRISVILNNSSRLYRAFWVLNNDNPDKVLF